MTRPFRLLVTGGRTYADRDFLFRALDRVVAKKGNLTIIHGAAGQVDQRTHRVVCGADLLAGEWARVRFHGSDVFAVNHEFDGPWPGAGPRRNSRMIAQGKPDAVVAFPGGDGTDDCVRQARAARLYVWDLRGQRRVAA